MALVVLGLVLPRSFDVFIPKVRRGEGDLPYAPAVLVGEGDMRTTRGMEEGSEDFSNEESNSKVMGGGGLGHDDSSREGRDSLDTRRRVEGDAFSEPKTRL